MPNTMSNVLALWLAGAMQSNAVLRNSINLLRQVSRDFDRNTAAWGDRVKVPLPAIKTASPLTPSMTPPTPSNTAPGKVEILLDQWYYSDFNMTDQEITQIEAGSFFVPKAVEGCVVAIVEQINAFLHTKTHGANGFFGYVGTAATNPFASNSDILADAKEAMTNNKSPLSPRVAIINPAAERAALKLAEFKDADKMGDQSVKVEGQLRRVMGFDPCVDQQVPTHIAGTGSGYLTNGVQALGATAITVNTGAGTILVGDIITFAGVTGTYNVVTALAAGSLTIYPGLASATGAAAAVTLKASHAVNVAFHPAAIQLVTRPLMASVQQMLISEGKGFGGNLVAQAEYTDPLSGLTIRASLYRGFGMSAVYFDALWGGEVVRPELGVRLAG